MLTPCTRNCVVKILKFFKLKHYKFTLNDRFYLLSSQWLADDYSYHDNKTFL